MGTLWTLQSSQPGLSFYSAVPLAYGTSYYAISLGSNIVMTVLIMARLLIYRRTITSSLGLSTEHARDYTSLGTIIIESASLYSVFAILFLITYAVNNPINQIFLVVANAAQVSSHSIASVPFELRYTANCKLLDHLPCGSRPRLAQHHGDRKHNHKFCRRPTLCDRGGRQRVYGLSDCSSGEETSRSKPTISVQYEHSSR